MRVIHLDDAIIKALPEEERLDVRSMLNDVLKVYDIDEYNQVWVEKTWDRGDGKIESHSLGLSSQEIELVE